MARTINIDATPPSSATLRLDLLVSRDQRNPAWVGDVQVFVSVPSRNVNDQSLGRVDLTPLARGAWVTVSLPISTGLLPTLTQPGATDVRFKLAVNTGGSAPLLVDNVRIDLR